MLYTAIRMAFFSHSVAWGGVSRLESRHQLVGKRYNSIRSQNGQDPFCSVMECSVEFKVAGVLVIKNRKAAGYTH